jgi:uncharacterized membrane protein YecN with MAPEG domain
VPEFGASRDNLFSPMFIRRGIIRDKLFAVLLAQKRLYICVGFYRIILTREQKNIIEVDASIKKVLQALKGSANMTEVAPMTVVPFEEHYVG